jgi:hypothetical protein
MDVTAKAGLLLLLAIMLMYPDLGHLRGKAAEIRSLTYPLVAFIVPILWWRFWRSAPFPWVADLLLTIPGFTDLLGNRMNFYDSIDWFDDGMHFVNTGLFSAGVILLTLHRTAPLGRTVERGLAFGATAALGWELFEYYAFLSGSSEHQRAYADTLSDLTLGSLGAVVAAIIVYEYRQRRNVPLPVQDLRPEEPEEPVVPNAV